MASVGLYGRLKDTFKKKKKIVKRLTLTGQQAFNMSLWVPPVCSVSWSEVEAGFFACPVKNIVINDDWSFEMSPNHLNDRNEHFKLNLKISGPGSDPFRAAVTKSVTVNYCFFKYKVVSAYCLCLCRFS